jgi:hypothetical protein
VSAVKGVIKLQSCDYDNLEHELDLMKLGQEFSLLHAHGLSLHMSQARSQALFILSAFNQVFASKVF